ncbi:phosphonatase-like hydrolase [Kutzneria buriramensis]|uniref:Phosphonatase-like hydrolase n=1 Tax=Kutzneria buriramensis TaxID=1045776 RepID=A0A3E0HZM6_9PSEU|nr:phosphonatase-like hydrolase [Kutzneria buriramensis]REH51909.1 phosphonatase-like hydrolase [Kutzneria buriramensis]
MTITLAVLDMAGTTVADDGLVERAFTDAIGAVGVSERDDRFPAMLDHVRRTMGQSKIVVFRALLPEAEARQANAAFEAAYGRLVKAGHCEPVPGAEQAIKDLRAAGVKVALTTGFARPTQDAIIAALGWQDLADIALTPADAGRGRPFPDMVLTAVLRLGVDDVREVAVVGDTPSDVVSGLRAGASVAAGVLTGAGVAADFEAVGATHVLESVRDLPSLLTRL